MTVQHSVAELQRVMRLIDDRLDEAVVVVPPRQRELVPNALLNLAVARLIQDTGTAGAATILHRLAALVAHHGVPAAEEAYTLTGHDA